MEIIKSIFPSLLSIRTLESKLLTEKFDFQLLRFPLRILSPSRELEVKKKKFHSIVCNFFFCSLNKELSVEMEIDYVN